MVSRQEEVKRYMDLHNAIVLQIHVHFPSSKNMSNPSSFSAPCISGVKKYNV